VASVAAIALLLASAQGAMADEQSGLPADSLDADGTRSVQTSTTNIGAYMWGAVVAERLGIISHAETCPRLPVWEHANDPGFIARHHVPGRGTLVSVSPAGAEHLA
jgi:hypothetical protein